MGISTGGCFAYERGSFIHRLKERIKSNEQGEKEGM